MQTVTLDLGGAKTPIFAGPGLLEKAGELIAAAPAAPKRGARCAVVTNTTVGPLYAGALEAALERAGFKPTLVSIPDGEKHKTLDTMGAVYGALARAGLERGSFIVALGGGVVGDLAGFAAATYLRGIPVVQAPTTLMAQVDSSIGGKTGFNLEAGKNLVGAFHQPTAVIADTLTLKTLPEREYRSGFAEIIKHGLIRDEGFAAFLESSAPALLAGDPALLEETVARSAAIKARVVEQDERESGLRAILNYGHTLGHALESVTNYTHFLHGEAVAVGMEGAAFLAEKLGLLTAAQRARQQRLLRAFGLPLRAAIRATGAELMEFMRRDKKIREGKIRLVLLEGIGSCRVDGTVEERLLLEAARAVLGPEEQK